MSRPSYYPQQQQQQQYQQDPTYQPQPRSSIHPNSNNQNHGAPPLTGAAARLNNKQKELQGLKLLREHSKRMADDIERLADQVDVLVKGGDSVADVLSGWQGVFRAIQIARADPTLLNSSQEEQESSSSNNKDSNSDRNKNRNQEEDHNDDDGKKKVLPETLVRIPLEGESSRE